MNAPPPPTAAGLPLHFVDVFAESKYAGNQLAVILDADRLSAELMQAIARETNFSETTFVCARSPGEGGWPVRIFTPREEVPFAGHPTLGTAWVIRQLFEPGSERLKLRLAVGSIRVDFEPVAGASEILWMRQKPPVFGPEIDPAEVADVLGLDLSQIDPRWPPRVVSTGLPALVVPLCDLDAVRRARLRQGRYRALGDREPGARLLLVFCQEAVDAANQLHARVFAEYFGVPEDPATGSANGCLAGYLVRHRVRGKDAIDLRVEQGWEMGRPSLLRLRARREGETIAVSVGGRVVPTMRGVLL